MTATLHPATDTAALTRDEARRLTARIRDALAIADDLLAAAFAGRAWTALGHASWEAYCAAELPELRHVKLRRPERQARIATLRAAAPDISVRDLAAATGASVGSVHADVATLTAPGPADTAKGPLHDPAAAVADHRPAAPAPSHTARLLAALDTRPGTVFDLCKRTRLRQAQVSPALSRLAAAGRITYTPPAKRGGTGTYATVTA